MAEAKALSAQVLPGVAWSTRGAPGTFAAVPPEGKAGGGGGNANGGAATNGPAAMPEK
ncbi:hypothetical protein GCM10027214_04340 [Stenotrophomonas tumulicola]